MLGLTLSTGEQGTRWTADWPTTPGVYWFWGFPWGKSKAAAYKDETPDLLCVHVRTIAKGCVYITEGYILSQHEGALGLWSPVTLPDLPADWNITS